MGYEKTAEEIDKDLKKAILQSIETNDFVEISERAYRVLRRRLSFSISPRRTAFEEFLLKKINSHKHRNCISMLIFYTNYFVLHNLIKYCIFQLQN